MSALFAGFFAAAWAATGWVLRWLRARHILDLPNHRSSHTVPTPRGGGLAVTPLVVLGFGGWFGVHGATAADWTMLAGAALLALVSWIDDRRTLAAAPRFGAQAVAVAAAIALMPEFALSGGLVPPGVEKLVLGLSWLWFVNLFNFMDGIDGITGTEALCISVGLLIAMPGAATPALLAILGGCVLGFLVWNWHPAKIFMGDVGSIPLGYVLGYLLLDGAARHPHGWAVALILPALYWADATITLVRRGLQGKAIWRAHREHFYQKATQGGWSHAGVCGLILIGNLCLIGMAHLAALGHPWIALGGAAAITALILHLFQARFRNRDDA